MSEIRTRIKTTTPETEFDKSLEQELLSAWLELSEIINGGLKAEDNWNAAIVSTADTGNADTEFAVTHSLKRTPIGFIVINNDKAGVVYDSGTAWTATAIYLKCNVANCAVKVIVL